MALPIFAALGKALPYITTAWSLYAQSKQKPKKEDYVPHGAMYERYINYLKSKTAESTVYHQRMRPALRQIGQQTQRGQRQVGYQVARQKPGGGIEAQMRMGINRQALEAIGIASERASVAQEQVNVRTGEQLLRIGVQEEAALQRYQRDKQRFTQQMFTSTVSAGLNMANIAVRQSIADTKLKIAAAKDVKEATDIFNTSLEKLKADNLIPQDTTPEQLQEILDTGDYQDPDMLHRHLGNIKKQETKDIKFGKDVKLEKYTADSIIARDQAIEEMRANPKQAQEIADSYKLNLTGTDLQAVLKEKRSLSKGLVPDLTKPFSMQIELSAAQHKPKELKVLVKKVYDLALIDPNISPDYIGKIADIQQGELDYQQDLIDTDQELSDKKAEIETDKIILQSSIVSLKESVLRWAKTYSSTATPTEKSIEALNKLSQQIGGKSIQIMSERDKYVKQLITTLDGIVVDKGMTLEDSTGLKRAIAGIIRTAESSEFGDVGLPTKKILTNLEIQLIGRVDAMLKKMPYDGIPDLVQGTYVE